MKNKIFNLIKETRSVIADKFVIAAVSGGKDSVFMLHILEKAKPKKLVVAHYNHKSRPESDSDEEFVKSLAKMKNLDFFSESLNEQPKKGESLEAFYREKRYEFLNKLRLTLGADYICVAHSANDIIETFLFKMITGRFISVPQRLSQDLNIFRPLFTWRTDEILKAISFLKLKFVSDQSNFDQRFDRNFIREIVNMITERFGPKTINNLLDKILEIEESRLVSKNLAYALLKRIEPYRYDEIKSCLSDLELDQAKYYFLNEWMFLLKKFYLGTTHLKRLKVFFEESRHSIQLPRRITLKKIEKKLQFEVTCS